jgi:hypothetical protein
MIKNRFQSHCFGIVSLLKLRIHNIRAITGYREKANSSIIIQICNKDFIFARTKHILEGIDNIYSKHSNLLRLLNHEHS